VLSSLKLKAVLPSLGNLTHKILTMACIQTVTATSIWDVICDAASGDKKKVKNLCSLCKASQAEKDQLTRVAAAEHAEGEVAINNGVSDVPELKTNLCCISRALSQQQDVLEEKPLIQQYIEDQGHICKFLPKFHCELDPIEMYWGWAKHSAFFAFISIYLTSLVCRVPCGVRLQVCNC
jgi:hypothetical protein